MPCPPLVIAHRGASGHYPENTLLAFQKAIDAGADCIEFDVVTTRDGVVVVSHDTRADRCTDGTGKLSAMTLAEVKQLDAGIRFGASFVGQRIPTFDEALDFFADQPTRLCIEIKGDTTEETIATAHLTVEQLRRRDMFQSVTITSFNADCLRAIKTWEPLLAAGLDPERQDGFYTPWQLCQHVLRSQANFLLHRYQSLTPDILAEAHAHGLGVWTWTVDQPDDMRRVAAMGVDAIMTNEPAVLRSIADRTLAL